MVAEGSSICVTPLLRMVRARRRGLKACACRLLCIVMVAPGGASPARVAVLGVCGFMGFEVSNVLLCDSESSVIPMRRVLSSQLKFLQPLWAMSKHVRDMIPPETVNQIDAAFNVQPTTKRCDHLGLRPL